MNQLEQGPSPSETSNPSTQTASEKEKLSAREKEKLNENESEPKTEQPRIDLRALFYAKLIDSLTKRNYRLGPRKRLRLGHLLMGAVPGKGNHIIGRVKRAQYRNAKKGRRVYRRRDHGGHF